MLWSSRVAAQLAASQAGLSSLKSVKERWWAALNDQLSNTASGNLAVCCLILPQELIELSQWPKQSPFEALRGSSGRTVGFMCLIGRRKLSRKEFWNIVYENGFPRLLIGSVQSLCVRSTQCQSGLPSPNTRPWLQWIRGIHFFYPLQLNDN
jgi:hypothetical protein